MRVTVKVLVRVLVNSWFYIFEDCRVIYRIEFVLPYGVPTHNIHKLTISRACEITDYALPTLTFIWYAPRFKCIIAVIKLVNVGFVCESAYYIMC